jgi:hypothetical protein
MGFEVRRTYHRLVTQTEHMAAAQPVTGGGLRVLVTPERIERWIAGFTERHGELVAVEPMPDDLISGVCLTASDGARARCLPAFPGLLEASVAGLLAHSQVDRRVGVLLVRLGGHASGVFEGRTLVASKVGSRQVHGRSSAGGWSQQRFARRRVGQVAVAQDAAAEVAVRILLPEVARLDAVVTGGDRVALAAVLGNRQLAALKPLVVQRVLDVVDPRLDVLKSSIDAARSVEITVHDP